MNDFMSNAYGALIFTRSDDCVYDFDGIINVLSNYSWSQEGNLWKYDEDSGSLIYGCEHAQEPTLFPQRPLAYLVVRGEDDKPLVVKAEQLIDEDSENAFDLEEDVPFDKLVNEISPFVKQGWIEFGCCAHLKAALIYFESMQIDFNNSGTRSRLVVCGGSNPGRTSEVVIHGVLYEH
jgi:hypothetical protein